MTPEGKWFQVQHSAGPNSPFIIVAEWPCRPPLSIFGGPDVGMPLPLGASYAPNAKIFTEASCMPRFDAAVADRALSQFDAPARKCLTTHRSGKAELTIDLLANGAVAGVYRSQPSSLNANEARCIGDVFRHAMSERFRDSAGRLIHRLVLAGEKGEGPVPAELKPLWAKEFPAPHIIE